MRPVSFRTVLLSVVLGLILISTLTTTGLGARGLRLALQTLLEKQIATTLEAVTKLVDEHFEPAGRLIESLSRDLGTGQLPISDPVALAKTFADDLEFEEGIAWISFGYPDGRFAGAWVLDGKQVINVSTPNGGPPREWIRTEEGDWQPFQKENLPAKFDARERVWFQLALENEGRVWSPPYDFASGGRGITVSQAVKAPDGALIGVLTVDFLLQDMADYLEKLTHDFRGDPLVFSVNGKILATPQALEKSEVFGRVREMVADPNLREQLRADPEGRVLEIPMSGDTFFVGLRVLTIPGGLECVSAILFSRKQVYAGVDQVVLFSLATALVALLLSLGVGYVMANRIASPLKTLALQLARIGDFQLAPSPVPVSPIREVKMLADSVERMRAGLESFSHYVPVDLVRDLVRSGGVAELGGERRDVGILFCDLAGFTSYSEKIAPEAAVKTLSAYFESFGSAISAEGGVIDKFLGDGVMGLFNAPAKIEYPAKAACAAALRGFKNFAGRKDMPEGFSVRVGLHWGEVLVGNVGTSQRFTYTAIGDAVNLCSRLEGLNKFYGTQILASAAMRDAAGESDFVWRHLDRVTVMGRDEALDLYQLMGRRSEVDDAVSRMIRDYSAAMEAFLSGDLAVASQLLREWTSSDQPSAILAERIQKLRATPGAKPTVRTFTHK